LGQSALADDLVQHARDAAAGKGGIHFQRQTFSRESDHPQHPDRSVASHRIVREIQRPLLIGRCAYLQRLSCSHAVLAFVPSICASVGLLFDMLLPFPQCEIILSFVRISGSRSFASCLRSRL